LFEKSKPQAATKPKKGKDKMTIKSETIKNKTIRLEIQERNGAEVYTVTLASYGQRVKSNTTPSKKNALATYNRYRKEM
jgi:hypothetical protein